MFGNVVGNEKVKNILEKSIELKKTSHSYLFVGKSGVGKKIIAKEFAKMILCLKNKEANCDCKSCIEFESDNNPDFIFINANNGSIKIDQIRNLQKQVTEKPIISNNKVCLIDDADLMTTEAQNCLLKTLEEPPEYMTIILIGTNESDFLATIKSRCTIIYFEKIKDTEIEDFLRVNYGDLNEINTIIDIADGSLGKAINIKNEAETYKKIQELINNIEQFDIIDLLKKSDSLYKSKDEIFKILEYVNVILINKSKKNYKYAKCISIVEETKKRIKANGNYNMCIDYMLFGIWGEVNEKYSWSQI